MFKGASGAKVPILSQGLRLALVNTFIVIIPKINIAWKFHYFLKLCLSYGHLCYFNYPKVIDTSCKFIFLSYHKFFKSQIITFFPFFSLHVIAPLKLCVSNFYSWTFCSLHHLSFSTPIFIFKLLHGLPTLGY